MNIANKLTMLRILMVPLFVLLMLLKTQEMRYIGAAVFVVAAFTDFLDGYLARKYDLVTTFGKFLDPLADKILTISAFILLVEFGVIPAWGVIVIVARELAITGFRVIAASENVTIAASGFGKIKTISQLLCLIALLFAPAIPESIGIVLFYIAVILTVLSGIDYLVKNKDLLDLKNI
ncbi:CDP-diacylglycerol--glycerol-3-phosphate 3-phosphatidyltransferase [Peptoniphilus ivorii]|uniref:CDP-diacylglycerol--glycerol-3-phosphate 3-phosphatidyltransferase n=1 Tax=Aedoeadaptatus ivorii TaxID=54006 RepID=UPI002788A95F|nr:CDP-diacylglycerol--glycerol-3-phosphate 3-phosphatidyltransferase [Peptoniphilus ivorii]MDQ0507823.1 CDP-diacylglycerol--glycerol-3-phosphate 3-phosphatidyltransferase [Peptoniphilus ivorii]